MKPYRILVLILALSLLAALPAVDAQQPTKATRIGLLLTGSPAAARYYLEAFHQGLRNLGYSEGQKISIEERWAEGGRLDQFRDLAADLAATNVSLIFAWGTTAATAAKQVTSTIPIVFVAVGDPVGSGLVSGLSRPGGNVTGLTNVSAELSAKLLELLREVVPRASPVGVLQNPANPASVPQLRWTELAARTFQIELQVVGVRAPNELDGAFSAIARKRARALVVLADPMFLAHRTRIAELAVRSRLPAAFNGRDYVGAGGLMS